MNYNIIVERGTEIANLKKINNLPSISDSTSMSENSIHFGKRRLKKSLAR